MKILFTDQDSNICSNLKKALKITLILFYLYCKLYTVFLKFAFNLSSLEKILCSTVYLFLGPEIRIESVRIRNIGYMYREEAFTQKV